MVGADRVCTGLVVASVITMTGCASGGPEELAPSELPTVEIEVHNRSGQTIAVYVQWEGLRPSQLGTLGNGRSQIFLPAFRSGGLCVTAIGTSTIAGAVPRREPIDCQGYFGTVERGERIVLECQAPWGAPMCLRPDAYPGRQRNETASS